MTAEALRAGRRGLLLSAAGLALLPLTRVRAAGPAKVTVLIDTDVGDEMEASKRRHLGAIVGAGDAYAKAHADEAAQLVVAAEQSKLVTSFDERAKAKGLGDGWGPKAAGI